MAGYSSSSSSSSVIYCRHIQTNRLLHHRLIDDGEVARVSPSQSCFVCLCILAKFPSIIPVHPAMQAASLTVTQFHSKSRTGPVYDIIDRVSHTEFASQPLMVHAKQVVQVQQ